MMEFARFLVYYGDYYGEGIFYVSLIGLKELDSSICLEYVIIEMRDSLFRFEF